MAEFLKKFSELPVVEAGENTYAQTESEGAFARVAVESGAVKTVNEVAADENGNVDVSWDGLTDRPFGEEGFSIEWDGVIGDRIFVARAEGAMKFVKIADEIISKESLVGARVKAVSSEGNEEIVIAEDAITDMSGSISAVNGLINVVETPGTYTFNTVGGSMNVDFPEEGIYFTHAAFGESFMYVSCLECSTVKTIDPKFIPSSTLHVKIEWPEDSDTRIASYTGREILTAMSQGRPIFAEVDNGSNVFSLSYRGHFEGEGDGIAFSHLSVSGSSMYELCYRIELDTATVKFCQYSIASNVISET